MLITQIAAVIFMLGALALAALILGGTLWAERAAIVQALRGNLFTCDAAIRSEATILAMPVRSRPPLTPLRAAA